MAEMYRSSRRPELTNVECDQGNCRYRLFADPRSWCFSCLQEFTVLNWVDMRKDREELMEEIEELNRQLEIYDKERNADLQIISNLRYKIDNVKEAIR